MCCDTAPCSGTKFPQLCLEVAIVIPVQVVVTVIPLVKADAVFIMVSHAPVLSQVPIGTASFVAQASLVNWAL